MSKLIRDSLAKQMIFECAMELYYHTEGLSNEVVADKLMHILSRLDTEDCE